MAWRVSLRIAHSLLGLLQGVAHAVGVPQMRHDPLDHGEAIGVEHAGSMRALHA